MRSRYEELPINEVQLDPSNPRVRHLLQEKERTDTKELESALTPGDTPYRSLREAIRQHGGLINPIKVNQTNDQLIVFEGNTRLVIYRYFFKKEIAGEWDKIPCHVYDNLTLEQVDKLRLQDHMIGTREWTPYDKAAYLTELHDRSEPLSGLIEFCGGNRSAVLRMIDAYNMMENEYRRALLEQNKDQIEDFDSRKFTAFEEFQKPSINSSLHHRGLTEYDFANWVAQEKFVKNEHVRKLPDILDNNQAYDAFIKDDSREAERHLIVDIDQELMKRSIPNLCRALYHATSIATTADLEQIKSNERNVNDIKDVVHKLTSFIETYLNEVLD